MLRDLDVLRTQSNLLEAYKFCGRPTDSVLFPLRTLRVCAAPFNELEVKDGVSLLVRPSNRCLFE